MLEVCVRVTIIIYSFFCRGGKNVVAFLRVPFIPWSSLSWAKSANKYQTRKATKAPCIGTPFRYGQTHCFNFFNMLNKS